MNHPDPATEGPTRPLEDARATPNPPPKIEHTGGLEIPAIEDEDVDRRLAEVEMIGEETAAGYGTTTHPPLAPEVRYLHVSRTINQLITDRNRSVGIFLFVASLLFGASTALLNAPDGVEPIVPLESIQYWCLPVTFGVLALLAIFASLILIRTRIGLIYEVAKMNILMGVPSGRVRRVNPFSIFFLMHLLVASLGGASAGMVVGMLARHARFPAPVLLGLVVGLLFLVAFEAMYIIMILKKTSDDRLRDASS